MPCCGGASGTCSCKIESGGGVSITGTGTASDPFVLTVDASLEGVDNVTFDASVIGAGSELDPYRFEVNFAATAKLDHIPDVEAPTPTNGQVLGWDNTLLRWTPRAPTTAAAGSVLSGDGLIGDGSVGSPLAVSYDAARRVSVQADMVGMTDGGLTELIQHFVDAGARAAILTAPVVNQLTALDTSPGRFDYFDGTIWRPVPGLADFVLIGASWLEISGAYLPGMRQTEIVKQVSTVTDSNGLFNVFETADLSGYSGVLTVQFQEDGGSGEIPYKGILSKPNSTSNVAAHAYRVDDGAVYPDQQISGTAYAVLY